MAGLRVHVVMPPELVERVDAARGDGSRGDFIRRAVLRLLLDEFSPVREAALPAPVEQSQRGPDVAAFRRATQR